MLREELEGKFLEMESKSWLRLMEVSLNTMEIFNDNIKDEDKITELIARTEKDDTVILAYEFVEPRQGEARYRVDYYRK